MRPRALGQTRPCGGTLRRAILRSAARQRVARAGTCLLTARSMLNEGWGRRPYTRRVELAQVARFTARRLAGAEAVGPVLVAMVESYVGQGYG